MQRVVQITSKIKDQCLLSGVSYRSPFVVSAVGPSRAALTCSAIGTGLSTTPCGVPCGRSFAVTRRRWRRARCFARRCVSYHRIASCHDLGAAPWESWGRGISFPRLTRVFPRPRSLFPRSVTGSMSISLSCNHFHVGVLDS